MLDGYSTTEKRKRTRRSGRVEVERQAGFSIKWTIRAGPVKVTADQRLKGSEGAEPCRYLGGKFPEGKG